MSTDPEKPSLVSTGEDYVGRDKITQGDEVHGDKVFGDKITIGHVGDETALAIGHGARATVQKVVIPRFVMIAVALVMFGVMFLSVIQAVKIIESSQPPRMTGDFNVAVAQFQVTGHGEGLGDVPALAQIFSNAIDRETKNLVSVIDQHIEIQPPHKTGVIVGKTEEERAANAHMLAEKVGAQVIIYGTIQVDGIAATIHPEFYVRGTEFANVAEVTGQYRMGSAIFIDKIDNLTRKREVANTLAERFRALMFVTYGLADYTIGNYNGAEDSFSEALKVQSWDNPDVIYVMLGNVALSQRDWTNAEKYYLKAQDINTDYARAWIGLGSVFLAQAMTNVQSETYDFDIPLLDKSIAAYQKALESRDQPPLADVSIKASFGLGEAYLRKALTEQESGDTEGCAQHYGLARQAFRSVIQAYETGNKRLQELAAHAHARLGLLFWKIDGPQAAIPEFERAISLLPDYGQGKKDKDAYQEILNKLRQN